MSDRLPTVLITGASSGLGAIYADRFAKRGHDLVLAARDVSRLEALATRLRAEAGVAVEVLPADLTKPAELAAVEARVRDDKSIGVLINNAGAAQAGGYSAADAATTDRLIALNVTALARLATAAGQRFARDGGGSIINIGSVVGLVPEIPFGVYGATKAFVQHLSQAMNAELGGQGVYIQAVLPSATRTEIWERGGMDINTIPGMMDADLLVDAALVGFDRREQVSLPSLPDLGQWQAFEAARGAMAPNFRQSQPAERYRTAAPESCAV
jgi:short-subunit dehydrogenase